MHVTSLPSLNIRKINRSSLAKEKYQNNEMITRLSPVSHTTFNPRALQFLTPRPSIENSFPLSPRFSDMKSKGRLERIQLPSISPKKDTKTSAKSYGAVKAYAVLTNQGLVRDYNEDRACIVINLAKSLNMSNDPLPKISYFGIFDGHGGSACADFLRNNLHVFLGEEPDLLGDPKSAIEKAFARADLEFLQFAQSKNDRSGSCSIILLIIDNTCYVANLGDSRAVLSSDNGKKIEALSRDHKPNDENERLRVLQAGGKLYQTPFSHYGEVRYGPLRVIPGKLAISRTFGDIEAKLPSLGGNPNVVIAIPEILEFEIS